MTLISNYASIEGTCYLFDIVTRTKLEAKEHCKKNKGKLWEPNTIEIINQVHSKAKELSKGHHFWVGIFDTPSEGTFKYDSNEDIFPFTPKTTPWAANEPNGGTTENCAVMNRDSPLSFHDVRCYNLYHSVCELSSE